MRARQTLADLIDGQLPEPVRLATRLTVEEALEGEQRDVPGNRGVHEHGANGKG